MKDLIPFIEKKQQDLEKSHFLKWLGNSEVPPENRLTFIPSMLFFIMGFKDILSALHIKDAKTELEHIISTHCEEDLDHWKWYIEDLQTLGFESWGEDLLNFSTQLWSEDTREARELIYKSFSYHYEKPTLLMDLVLLEVMEATFGAFTKSMEKCVKEAGRFENLKFFGQIHHEAEANHASGSWLDEASVEDAILKFDLSPEERVLAKQMVSDLFQKFDSMFDMWFNSKDKYLSIKSIPSRAAITENMTNTTI